MEDRQVEQVRQEDARALGLGKQVQPAENVLLRAVATGVGRGSDSPLTFDFACAIV